MKGISKMNAYYIKSSEETAKILETDINNGLSSNEAMKRLKKNGENKIEEKKTENIDKC